MPTIVNLKLRDDASTNDPIPVDVLAEYEDVDLDQLTPRARALAEAIAQSNLRTPTDILVESDRGERRSWRGWSHYPATSSMAPAAWLESEARKIPADWHVFGVSPDRPVPSLQAGADDQHLTRDAAMKRIGMSPAAWDTLLGTGHLPEPDRYVHGKPQWRPEAIDAYASRDRELWPISRVAEYLGYEGPSATGSARKQLHRWGFAAEGRAPGRGGESLYTADQIQAAHTHRPGQGKRTDLTPR